MPKREELRMVNGATESKKGRPVNGQTKLPKLTPISRTTKKEALNTSSNATPESISTVMQNSKAKQSNEKRPSKELAKSQPVGHPHRKSTLDRGHHKQLDENSYESYDAFVEKFKERPETPLKDQIWPDEYINAKKKTDTNTLIQEQLKFGSLLSPDAGYAMLKTYEDIIYSELETICPETVSKEQLTKTKTQLYINLPKIKPVEPTKTTTTSNPIRENDLKLPSVKTNRPAETSNTNDLRQKYYVSKKLEKAMNIYDEIKRRKGELTTSSTRLRSNDIVSDYVKWKNQCFTF